MRQQLFLQYARCKLDIPRLLRNLALDEDAEPDVVEQAELEDLAHTVPILIDTLPRMFEHRTELKQRVCLAEMLSALLQLVKPLRLHGLVFITTLGRGYLLTILSGDSTQDTAWNAGRSSSPSFAIVRL